MQLQLHEDFLSDNYIDIEYDIEINSNIVQLNEVGATGSTASGELFYKLPETLSDDNTIYVSAETGNDNNSGTHDYPVATLTKAQTLCSSTKPNIVILDSSSYDETINFEANKLQNIYAAKGKKPILNANYEQLVNDRYIVNITQYRTNILTGLTSYEYINDSVLIAVVVRPSSGNGRQVYLHARNKTGGVAVPEQLITFSDVRPEPHRSAYNPASHCIFLLGAENSTIPSGKARVIVLNEDFSVKKAETLYYNSSLNYHPCVTYPLSNGNFLHIFQVYDYPASAYKNVYMQILTPNLEAVTGTISLSSDQQYAKVGVHEANGHIYILINFNNLNHVYIHKYTINGTYVSTQTINNIDESFRFVGTFIYKNPILPTSNPNHVLVPWKWNDGTYTNAYGISRIDLTTGQVIKKEVIQRTNDNVYARAFTRLQDGLYILTYNWINQDYTQFEQRVTIVDENVEYKMAPVALWSSTSVNSKMVQGVSGFSDGSYLFTIFEDVNNGTAYFSIRKYDAQGITNSVAASINGITLRRNGKISLESIIASGADLLLNFCTIEKGDNLLKATYAVKGSGNITLQNCRVVTDSGVNTTGNITANYSQFIFVKNYYALKGDTVAINHCDFVNCYGAAEATTLTLKNSIIYRPTLATFEATSYTYTNCCDTAAPVAGETNVVHGAPLYINDGFLDLNDIDLNLRMRILGYPFDSAASYLADDGYHAGSLLVRYESTAETYKRVRLPKDRFGIERTIEPVTPIKLQKKDGSIATARDALQEVITVYWRAMTLEDFLKLLDVFNYNPKVRVYFNPVTYPDTHYQYTLVYKTLTASANKSIYFSSKYVQDVSIQLVRGLS